MLLKKSHLTASFLLTFSGIESVKVVTLVSNV